MLGAASVQNGENFQQRGKVDRPLNSIGFLKLKGRSNLFIKPFALIEMCEHLAISRHQLYQKRSHVLSGVTSALTLSAL
jgi:hypothetical protein